MLVDSGDLRKLTLRVLLFSALLSLILHLLFVLFTGKLTNFARRDYTDRPAIEVQLMNRKLLEAVDTFQETAEEKPDQADFASSRDLKADEETSPEVSPSNVVQAPQTKGQPQPQQQTQTQAKPQPKKVESFSLSQEELLALNDPLRSAGASDRQQDLSPGFVKRLQKGEELKINALGLDYGQYLVRMKERLVQRWRPRNTINPSMYEYKEISVTLAVVLNDKGELVDLRVIQGSFFRNYDDEAMRAFRASAPFPNPPDSLIQDDGRVYLPWSFHLTFGGWAASTVN
jgi:TonB family protein